MMKKIYLFLIVILTISFTKTNAATGTIDLSGKILVDINGDTFDLEQIQNDGYTIIFDFWATWCNPCLASVPALDEIWQAHGPDGDKTFMVFSIETDNSTTNELAIISQYNINNPVFIGENNTSVRASNFAYGGSIPYFVVVCPDGSWEDNEGAVFSPNTLLDKAVCFNDDAKVSGSREGSSCPSSSWLPELTLKNVGRTTLTAASVEIFVDGEFHEVLDWNGTMQSGGQETLTATQSVEYKGVGTQEISYNIVSVNSGTDGNVKNDTLKKSKSFNIAKTLDISLELIIDDYPEEMGYQVTTLNNTIISSAAAGVYNNASSNPVIDITLPTVEECYKVKLTDSWGDGSGGFIVKDSTGVEVIANTEAFTTLLESELYVSFDSDGDSFADIIEDLNGSDKNDETSTPLTILSILDNSSVSVFNVYPNPTNTFFSVKLELINNVDATITLTDLLGKEITSKVVTDAVTTFETSTFNSGVYFVNVKSEGKVIANSKLIIK